MEPKPDPVGGDIARPTIIQERTAIEEDSAPELLSRPTEGANIATRKIRLNLKSIKLDQMAQPRKEISTLVVADYTETMKDREKREKFPALVVFHDGEDYWLADGFHRYWAAVGSKQPAFDCEVHDGGLREAILYSVSANATHGYRRSNEDKRRAVMTVLNNALVSTEPEMKRPWSNREIARLCAVDETLVRKLRQVEPDPSAGEPQIDEVVVFRRGGKILEQKKGSRGKAAKVEPPEATQEQRLDLEACEPATSGPKADAAAQDLPRTSMVADLLRQIQHAFEQLPPPSEVAQDFPSTLTSAKAQEISEWFRAFSNSLEEENAQTS